MARGGAGRRVSVRLAPTCHGGPFGSTTAQRLGTNHPQSRLFERRGPPRRRLVDRGGQEVSRVCPLSWARPRLLGPSLHWPRPLIRCPFHSADSRGTTCACIRQSTLTFSGYCVNYDGNSPGNWPCPPGL